MINNLITHVVIHQVSLEGKKEFGVVVFLSRNSKDSVFINLYSYYY